MIRNKGFSLIELMVAMVVGLIIILGAGQLFLTVFQTNRQVDVLSEKQAAINFAVETLLKDIRRANTIDWDEGSSTLTLTLPNRGDVSTTSCGFGDSFIKVYQVSESDSDGWALEVAQECPPSTPVSGFSEVVTAFLEDGLAVDETLGSEGVWVITFKLISTSGSSSDDLTFYVVNRTAAVTEL